MPIADTSWRERSEAAQAAWAAALAECAHLITRPMAADRAAALMRAFATAERRRAAVQAVIDQSAGPAVPVVRALPDPLYLMRLRAVLRLAQRIGPVLRAIVQDAPVPLYPAPPRGLEAETASASDRLLWVLHQVINPAPQDDQAATLGAFADIPLKMSAFLQHIHAARRIALAQGKPEARFLDLGCGGGMKVLAAADAFGVADGLDYDPGYVAVARGVMALAGNRSSRILLADGLSFDGYGAYDVIYLFQPLTQGGRLAELERRVVAQARAGTLIVAPYPWFADHHADYGCVPIEGAVYGVGISGAAALRSRAEAMGLALRQPLSGQDYLLGPLLPIVRAMRAVGYDLG